ncbi:unnamed protein product [Pseudo-nitzschia multistriata]|uniref:non-specific serine/threonine protein kinase n=1 Tax=Pseudo-nitzschia multistriata TaxID=183589 RepID=A0A448Z9E2_9STRA|nr:unnamed protein product [Pseudo-nitzschia multistriata]
MDMSEACYAAVPHESSPLIRKKKTKLLPVLLWVGLAYAVFQETSSHVRKSVSVAAEVVRSSTKNRGNHYNNDPVHFDDTDTLDIDDLHEPVHRSFGSDVDIDVDIDSEGIDWDNDEDKDENIERKNSARTGPNIILVATVDGTIAGISKESGTVLWRQSEDISSVPSSSSSSSSYLMMESTKNDSCSPILKPLVSTTTTKKSASDASYKVVPSVDGTIYTTTNDMTIATPVKDLVAKSPFLDQQGRFYVGSQYASTAALDGTTGEVLRVVSSTATTIPDDEDDNESSLPTLDDPNIVWIGRVDHEVSIQDAKTGFTDAQFSVGQVMSVEDMRGMMRESVSNPEQTIRPNGSSLLSKAVATTVNEAMDLPNSLVATPNGNAALWSFENNKFAWVASESLNSPIVYAMDAETGVTLRVDIIPDVPDPKANIRDLTREMERQSRMASVTNTPVVGAMSNGQLYALPLRSSDQSTSSATIDQLPTQPGGKLIKSPLPIGDGENDFPDSSLVIQKEEEGFFHPKYGYISPKDLGGFVHPVYGYVSPRDLFGAPKRSSKTSSLFRVLGSWLPPTIALLFVISFELGRRKRLKDEKKGARNSLHPIEQKDQINGVISFNEDSGGKYGALQKSHHQEVISVSEDVLGYGGHGTVVYKGVLDGRDVAVKRMLKAYHASADREISLLIESDGDPNVVRYFLKEVRGDFVYLALELCDLSLHELIGVLREKQQEKSSSILPNADKEACVLSNESVGATTRILLQIASGVKHLHSLRIVHRDLKPANILLAVSKKGKKKVKEEDPIFATFTRNYYDAKISDMGLGKQLIGQSSIGASFIGDSSFRGNKSGVHSIGVGPGTVGWQAPEVMAMRLTSDTSARSTDSASNIGESKEGQGNDILPSIRTSRSVDIFSLGCIFYSLLIPGSHPFGEWFEREANIMHNRPNLKPLTSISSEAYRLIRSMLDRNPRLRPTAKEVCEHPFFWNAEKKLTFLCDFSDRLETDTIAPGSSNVFGSFAIERGALEVVGTSWEEKLDSSLVDNVQKFRTYDYSCVRDLLRLIRNKHHHFEELPEAFRLNEAPNQNALCKYFTKIFPALIMHCYTFCGQNLTDDDPLVLKFVIPPAKFQTREFSTAPISVSVKEETIPTNHNEAVISSEELKNDSTDTQCLEIAQVVTCDSNDEVDEDIIVWEGSIAAKTFNNRGWSRSQDEWSRHIEPFYKKRDPASKRCMEDPKFRTRLCNHWDMSLGAFCPMKKKNKCVFAHGPAELRVKEGKKNRWGKLVDKNGNNSNPWHCGGEDTYGAANSIELVRKEEGKWNASKDRKKNQGTTLRKKKPGSNSNQVKQKTNPKAPA